MQQYVWREVEPLIPAEGDSRYLPTNSLPAWWLDCLRRRLPLWETFNAADVKEYQFLQ